MRTYGKIGISIDNAQVHVVAEPQVRAMFRRVFVSLKVQGDFFTISLSPQNAETIEWLLLRYPMDMEPGHRKVLEEEARQSRLVREECEEVLNVTALESLPTKIALREYQLRAVRLLLKRKSLLVGDDLGLGKTAIALGAMATGLSAIVVCMTHLQQQWVDEALRFVKGVIPHIVKKGTPYQLPTHNMLVITYSKLAGWAEKLTGYGMVVFDEAQEVRRENTAKYEAAKELCAKTPHRLGLTATPVYNYGDEIFNIVDLLDHGLLGRRDEFIREWCSPAGMHYKVDDPESLGSHLMENHVFLRRRRSEVGRELPPLTKVVEEVRYDTETLLKNEDRALELAKLVLNGEWTERGKAAMMLSAMLRMQTGIAKAPFVADFVRQLVDNGEFPCLIGWHREVYEVWKRLLAQHGIESVLYTGTETPRQKIDAVERFTNGKARVFIGSLRSGAGLNGLQHRSSVIVFGELDWSPKVHEQWTGRLRRDGQEIPVTEVYLYAAGGADPVIASVLGIKRAQSDGIINPGAGKTKDPIGQQAFPRAGELARKIIAQSRRHEFNPPAMQELV